MEKVRQSNFELLRILCMWGVLTTHVLQSLYDLHTTNFTIAGEIRILLMNASLIAVNCFVLISGYFRINISWKGFFGLYTTLLFYIILFTVGYILFFGLDELDVMRAVKSTIFPLSESGMWFITTYFALFLISPLLNRGYSGLSNKEKNYALLLLLIVDIYIGYMHQSIEVTTDGYHLIHFILLYILGCRLSEMKFNFPRLGMIFAFLVVIMTLLHAVKMFFFPISVIYSGRYNSPMVMLASFVFFLWASTWNIKSAKINWVSSSVLAVYIVHSLPLGSELFFGYLKDVKQSQNNWTLAVIVPLIMLLLYVVSILLDKLRLMVCKPIIPILSNLAENTFVKIENYIVQYRSK